MPYTMTRAQAARRLAIRAYMDARPGATYAEVQERFGAGPNVVRDASCKTVDQWAAIVAVARAADVPRAVQKAPAAPVHRPATSASPGMVFHPSTTREARLSHARALGEGDDDWLPEPVDFDQDEPLEEAGLIEKKRKRLE